MTNDAVPKSVGLGIFRKCRRFLFFLLLLAVLLNVALALYIAIGANNVVVAQEFVATHKYAFFIGRMLILSVVVLYWKQIVRWIARRNKWEEQLERNLVDQKWMLLSLILFFEVCFVLRLPQYFLN
ncbi:hypothetical protein [Hahella ganghwensis]|uniref:hypothetical protein n=1 Tax=Hahella ganghwensis TaxID=286420 RepID=UPI000381DB4D|nr:hypothetical protein [Hahella ganghwensis]